jgi:hypothetical protein
MLVPLRHFRTGLLLLVALPVLGQALRVSTASGAPGEEIALDISLDSAAGSAPAALKWQMVFPARLLEVEKDGPEASSASKKSGKSLTCALREAYSYVCVLAGGEMPIANGSVATIWFKIRTEAHAGTSIITIDQVEAVTRDLKTVKLSGAEGRVLIH